MRDRTEMSREQRPGDWAAWMGTPPPLTGTRPPAPAPVPAPGRDTPGATTVAEPAPVGQAGGGPDPAPVDPAVGGPDPSPVDPAVGGPDPSHEADAPRSARREATRQRILDAARAVFAEKGVIGGTVEDICERAGFTRGAFYSNFGDKDDVVDALIEREHSSLLGHLDVSFAAVEGEIAESGDLPSILGSIVDRILRSVPIDRQLSLIQTELEIFAIRRPDQAGRFVEINSRFRARIAALLDDAMRRHGRELLVDPLLITDAIIAVAQGSVRRGLLDGADADPDAMASAILPALLLALSKPSAAA